MTVQKHPKRKAFVVSGGCFEYEIASQTFMMSQAAVTVLEERFKPSEGVVGIARAFQELELVHVVIGSLSAIDETVLRTI